MAAIIRRTYLKKLPTGKTVRKKCRHWTVQWRDAAGKIRRRRGYSDKTATMQLAAKLEKSLAWGEEGLTNPYKVHRAKPITQHLADFIDHLKAGGRADKYILTVRRRLDILIDGCGWETLPDVDAPSFLKWRQQQKAKPRNGTRKDLKGTSASTLNHYLDAANAFLNWCVKPAKRLPANPLADVDKVEGEKVRKRRALTDEEVLRLLAKAPAERAIVYRVGLSVGLRRAELKALKWGDVGLVAVPAFIQLRAEATKARRGDRVYLPATLADDLRKLRPEDAGAGDPVFRVPSLVWWKIDLAAAGIPYRDGLGRAVDFHAGTRKTLCTRMHRAGQPLALAMRVMRHADARLTMQDYVDDDRLGLAGAVLPEVTAADTSADTSGGGERAKTNGKSAQSG